MRYLVRKELDLEKPVNLRRLSPRMKIYAGIASKWRGTSTYKRKMEKRKEAAYTAMMRKDERLKDALLAIIFKELDSNTSMGKRGEVCKEMIVSVHGDYRNSVGRILGHKDFLMYDISVVDENPDIRIAFPTMPMLLRVSKKLLKEA